MVQAILSWAVLGTIVVLLIGVGFAVLSMTPPGHRIAEVCFCLAAVILLARFTYWAATATVSRKERLAVTLLVFGITGMLLILGLNWVEGMLHRTVTATSLDHILQSRDPVLVIEPEDAMIRSQEDYKFQFHLYDAGTSDVERVEVYENYYLVDSSAPLHLSQVGPVSVKASTIIPLLKAKRREFFTIDYREAYPALVEARKAGNGGGWVAELRLRYRRTFDGALFTMRKVMWILGPRLLVDDTKRQLPAPPPGFPDIPSLSQIGDALGGLAQTKIVSK